MNTQREEKKVSILRVVGGENNTSNELSETFLNVEQKRSIYNIHGKAQSGRQLISKAEGEVVSLASDQNIIKPGQPSHFGRNTQMPLTPLYRPTDHALSGKDNQSSNEINPLIG